MDPDACLQRCRDAIKAGDMDEARDAMEDLTTWIAKGGFLPKGGIAAVEEVQALID
jgi:hypothetical protein